MCHPFFCPAPGNRHSRRFDHQRSSHRCRAEETFAALLEADLKSRGVEARVTNVGIGGERTDGALARLEKDVLAKKPRLVTVMYGTNDSYVDKGKTDSRTDGGGVSAESCGTGETDQETPARFPW